MTPIEATVVRILVRHGLERIVGDEPLRFGDVQAVWDLAAAGWREVVEPLLRRRGVLCRFNARRRCCFQPPGRCVFGRSAVDARTAARCRFAAPER